MNNQNLLILAMTEQCKALIEKSKLAEPDLPKSLHPKHLLWMCEQMLQDVEEFRHAKLHRWIGFIQGGMIANHMLDFDEMSSMFQVAKNAYEISDEEDEDLIDHLDPHSSFVLDIGGES